MRELDMVAIAVEHFGIERLTCETVHELEGFLGRSLDLFAIRQLSAGSRQIRQVQELCVLDSTTVPEAE